MELAIASFSWRTQRHHELDSQNVTCLRRGRELREPRELRELSNEIFAQLLRHQQVCPAIGISTRQDRTGPQASPPRHEHCNRHSALHRSGMFPALRGELRRELILGRMTQHGYSDIYSAAESCVLAPAPLQGNTVVWIPLSRAGLDPPLLFSTAAHNAVSSRVMSDELPACSHRGPGLPVAVVSEEPITGAVELVISVDGAGPKTPGS